MHPAVFVLSIDKRATTKHRTDHSATDACRWATTWGHPRSACGLSTPTHRPARVLHDCQTASCGADSAVTASLCSPDTTRTPKSTVHETKHKSAFLTLVRKSQKCAPSRSDLFILASGHGQRECINSSARSVGVTALDNVAHKACVVLACLRQLPPSDACLILHVPMRSTPNIPAELIIPTTSVCERDDSSQSSRVLHHAPFPPLFSLHHVAKSVTAQQQLWFLPRIMIFKNQASSSRAPPYKLRPRPHPKYARRRVQYGVSAPVRYCHPCSMLTCDVI